ncbi:MAG: SHOCT domain-containing protein [Propionicimonas sp.]
MFAGVLGFVGTLAFLGLTALLIVFLIKRYKNHGKPGSPAGFGMGHHHHPPMPPALQVLDERLARGEIEIEDYVARKAAMLGTGPTPNEWAPPPPQPRPAPAPGPVSEPPASPAPGEPQADNPES